MLLPACHKEPLDTLVDASFVHLEAAADMLRNGGGDERKLVEAAMGYRAEHGAEFRALRESGEKLLTQLSAEQRRTLATTTQNRAAPILAEMAESARRYPDAQRALAMVRPLVVAGTPRLRPGQKPLWTPPDLPAPPTLDMFGPHAATSTAP